MNIRLQLKVLVCAPIEILLYPSITKVLLEIGLGMDRRLRLGFQGLGYMWCTSLKGISWEALAVGGGGGRDDGGAGAARVLPKSSGVGPPGRWQSRRGRLALKVQHQAMEEGSGEDRQSQVEVVAATCYIGA